MFFIGTIGGEEVHVVWWLVFLPLAFSFIVSMASIGLGIIWGIIQDLLTH